MPHKMANKTSIAFTVLGGGGEVGANCFEITHNGYTILLDCGTHPKKDGYAALPELSLLTKAPDVLLLSHAHIDHCGAIPYLLRQFPSVRIYATLPTHRIMDRMLHNSVSVMGILARERGITEYPLYEHEDVGYAVRQTRACEFEDPFFIGRDSPTEVTFHPAGHVLGCASILLRMPGHTLFYTGDICECAQELMGPYRHRLDCEVDTLVIESTQGAADDHRVRSYTEESLNLGEHVASVIKGGGCAMVPCFALGRMQEVLNILARQQEEGLIPQVPIYASGLGRSIYEVYERYQECLHPDAYLRPMDHFKKIGNVWEPAVSQALLNRPCIIVATSGMMLENTPSAMIAQEMVKYNHHGIFFVGYLDHETLGYQLLHSKPGDSLRFGLGRPKVEIKLENIKRFHLSAHAPRAALKKVVERIKPKNVIFVHGDPDALAWMRENAAIDGCRAIMPSVGQSFTLDA